MDLTSTKKRKPSDDNGGGAAGSIHPSLTPSDAQKLISFLTPDQLQSAAVSALLSSPSLLSAVRSFADTDPSQRKLFIRGLSWETSSDSLRSLFSSFGDLEEAVIIADKTTGKSKGYGFITFKHIDGAILALKEPSKQIDGRITITQLASAGNTGTVGVGATPQAAVADVALRKIYVGNVPADMPSERLLSLFSTFGEVEEGPLGLDKNTGKFRGYALFVYKTEEGEEEEELEVGDGVSAELEGEGEVEEGGDFVEEESYPEPPEDAKLFVGNLPYDVDSQQLAELFNQAGVVELAEVIYNRETDQSRGFGFISMSTVEEAEKAVEMFNRYDYNGRLLTVNKAAPRGARPERPAQEFESSFRIYVGNLPWQVDDARLEQVFSEHGKVVSARVVSDRETGRSRGFGFVTMASQDEQQDAISALDGQTLDGRAIRVNVAEERPRRGSF